MQNTELSQKAIGKTPALSDTALLAVQFINQTNRSVFLTGKAGTGKTTLLKYIIANTHKKAVIAAPTGIAALNAGGVTIHSLFQLPFGSFVPQQISSSQNSYVKFNVHSAFVKSIFMNDNKRKLLQELELLIIDEVSMLRADLLDAIDTVLRYVRRKNYAAFGGVQVLFIGDLLQLPPVVKNEEWDILKAFHKSIYFFDARVLQNEKPVYIELEKIYRQDDAVFISLLNNLRNNKITNTDADLLNKYYKPGFTPSPGENYITLTTHNNKAISLNKSFLKEIKTPSLFFEAEIKGDFSESAYPLEKTLELKHGSQVMFVKNDTSGKQRFFNGKIGVISKLNKDTIEVICPDEYIPIKVEKYTWENKKYVMNTDNEIEEDTVGTFNHYPIKLAWAITVHKSQGLTFDKAIIDIADAFAPGQIYVALSRLRSLNGLVLTSRVSFNSIQSDEKIQEFSKTGSEQEDPVGLMNRETILFLEKYILDSLDLTYIIHKLNEHGASYAKDEKRSGKQKYHSWALELKNKFSEIMPQQKKAVEEIKIIFVSKGPLYHELLFKRVMKASEDLAPTFKKISLGIVEHIKQAGQEKKMKSYIKELQELELVFFSQLQKINKAVALCRSVCEGTEFNRNEVNKIAVDDDRKKEISHVINSLKDDEPGERRERRTTRRYDITTGKKLPKLDTKEESYKLYQQGKKVTEIAVIRGFTSGTIEGHLAFYVGLGKININEFVTAEKLAVILSASKKLETTNSGPIKQLLGEDYSYGEIKMALAKSNI